MSFKSVDVVMLSGKNIFDGVIGTPMRANSPMIKKSYDGFEQGGYLFYHLYFLSDEEIKEGDWYVNKHSQVLNYSIGQDLFHVKGKIIATTDKSLMMVVEILDVNGYGKAELQIPQPSQSFIEKYIEAYNSGNPITKVMVEYEVCYAYLEENPISNRLKINKDNTITIRKVKDSWSRDEQVDIIEKYLLTKEIDAYKRTKRSDIKKWIEENL